MTSQVYNRLMRLCVAIIVLAEAALGRGVISDGDIVDENSLDLQHNNTDLRVERIANGKRVVDRDSWPYMALLAQYDSFSGRKLDSQMCAGTLISKQWVLTAAHCLFHQGRLMTNNEVRVILGNLRVDSGLDGLDELIVEDIVVHRDFRLPAANTHAQHDIALVKLASPVETYNKVQVVPNLDDGRMPRDESNCKMAGWGQTGPLVPNSEDLMEADIAVIPNDECRIEMYGLQTALWSRITNGHICAYDLTPWKINVPSGCYGDSGGPLMCRRRHDKERDNDGLPGLQWPNNDVQVGVLSFADSTCTGITPTVFTRVSHYISWIKQKCNNCIHNNN